MRGRLAAVVSLMAAIVAGCAEINAPGYETSTSVNGSPSSEAPSSRETSSGTASRGSSSAVLAAARMWASFPAAANPRPIILFGSATLGPQAFPDGDTKLAFGEGRVQAATSMPAGPTVRDGYPLLTARQAFEQLRSVSQGKANGPPTSATVIVTAIALTDYNFATDRGSQSLPAWRMHLRHVTGDIYVLAVAPSARYPLLTERAAYDAGPAVPSADGRRLTINFIPRHDSTGPCDPGYRSSLQVGQTPTAIVLAVTITLEPTMPSNVACPASGASVVAPARPVPGALGTRTITLAEPLDGRVVVDSRGTPYIVSAH